MKSMEDVWTEISLSTLHRDIMPSSTNNQNHNTTSISVILPDFLADPFKNSANTIHPRNQPHTIVNFKPDQILSCVNFNNSKRNRDVVTAMPCDLPALFDAKKRALEAKLIEGFCAGNDRKNRMIKNRESAARSRARKQAYTNELELEVAHLLRENKKLKRQYAELHRVIDAQVPAVTKSTLQRTLTAPF